MSNTNEKKREFSVWVSKNQATKVVIGYFVSDAKLDDELKIRPRVAEFPVGEKYDAETQQCHAELFCEYMNKIQTATRQAYENNLLLDMLKAP